jgi:hypothetical protein
MLALTAIAATVACHGGAGPNAGVTASSDSTATVAVTRPLCPATSPDSAWVRWPVDTLAIRLPPRYHPSTARLATRRRWEAPDSSAIEIWFTDTPVLSVGGSAIAQFRGEGACSLIMGGRAPVIVVRYWAIQSGHQDTLYNAATTSVFMPGHAVDVTVSSRTRPARDELLGALADLELPMPVKAAGK